MAREYARIRISIASDHEFEDLTPAGQWLFTRILIPEPTLNHCGIADWRPRRLLGKAAGLTLAYVLGAARDLEAGRYALFDDATEEVLVRSYIRTEELLRNPKMAQAVIGSYRAIASRTLRAAVVTEIRRAHIEHPEYSSWKAGDVGVQLAEIMEQKTSAEVPYVDIITVPVSNPEAVGITNRAAVPNTYGSTVPITNPVPGADYQSGSVDIPCTSFPAASYPATQRGGYEVGEQDSATPHDPNDPPPPTCPKHPAGTELPCPPCGVAREKRKAWDAHQAGAAARQRAALAAEIHECEFCDENGWVETDEGLARCQAHNWPQAVSRA